MLLACGVGINTEHKLAACCTEFANSIIADTANHSEDSIPLFCLTVKYKIVNPGIDFASEADGAGMMLLVNWL